MALKLEIDDVRLSTETTSEARVAVRTRPLPEDALPEAAMSNRRRAITGLILAAVVLFGAVVWRYVDSRADPSALVTSLERGDATGTP